MIVGGDFSHFNTQIPQGLGFIWLKATEGKNWIDPAMVTHLENIAKNYKDNLPIMGFYHYAQPDINEPEVEAEYFTCTIHDHLGKCLLALDWEEPEFLKRPTDKQVEWINKFCKYVYDKCKVVPFLYCSRFHMLKVIRGNLWADIPLWLADYNGNVILNLNGKGIDMQQVSNKIFDLDLFHGSKDYLVSFALPRK